MRKLKANHDNRKDTKRARCGKWIAKSLIGTGIILSTVFSAHSVLNEEVILTKTERKYEQIYKTGKLQLIHPIPILLYHDVSERTESRFRLPIKKFEKQLQFLKERGFTTVTLASLLNGPISEKAVILTFDDISMDFYNRVFPLLKKYDMKATAFLIVNMVLEKSKKGFTWEKVEEMENSGLVDVQSHTMNHLDLRKCDPEKIEEELVASKYILQFKLNKQILFIALPYGRSNENIRKTIMNAGYKGCVGVDSFRINKKIIDLTNIGRCEVNYRMDRFERLLDRFDVTDITDKEFY